MIIRGRVIRGRRMSMSLSAQDFSLLVRGLVHLEERFTLHKHKETFVSHHCVLFRDYRRCKSKCFFLPGFTRPQHEALITF